VQKHLKEFETLKTKIKAISFAEPPVLKDYKKHFEWKLDLYADPQRKLYHLFGLKRLGVLNIFHPKSILKYTTYFLQGKKIQKATQDIYQMGGDFILNAEGRLTYAFRSHRPDDRPSVNELLKALSTKS